MNYHELTAITQKSLNGEALDLIDCKTIFNSQFPLLAILNAAFAVRSTYWGRKVQIHIINNIQNGFCPEDCHYCAQAKSSKAPIEKYNIKSDEEVLLEAKRAYESGAHRYCMVMAGRGPSTFKTKKVAQLIRTIKEKYPIQVCLSAGIVDKEKAAILSEAGLDRLNHNLNASESKYASICSTHTFQDRVNTLEAAKSSGLEVCSGVIIGMGESIEDIFSLAQKLNQMNVESIPVNFYIPIKGTKLEPVAPHLQLTPEFCLRALSLFRFMNPKAEIRLAAGREFHLRSLQPMGLYPANSIFLDGYLNTKGSKIKETFTMIKDLGFDIESKQDLESILSKTSIESIDKSSLKTVKELRPTVTTS